MDQIELAGIDSGREFLARVVIVVPRGAIEPGADVYPKGSIVEQSGRANPNVIWVAMDADYAIIDGKRVSLTTLVPQRELLATEPARGRSANSASGAGIIPPSRTLRMTVTIDNK